MKFKGQTYRIHNNNALAFLIPQDFQDLLRCFHLVFFLFSCQLLLPRSAIDFTRSREIPTTTDGDSIGFYELLVAHVRPDTDIRPDAYPTPLECLDLGYLHSRMYFAPERTFRSTDPRRRPSISDHIASFPRPYPRWWNLRCYGAVKPEWNYRIFSWTFAHPDGESPQSSPSSLWWSSVAVRISFRSRGAISYTSLVNFALRRDGRLTSREIVLNASTADAARATYNVGVTMSALVRNQFMNLRTLAYVPRKSSFVCILPPSFPFLILRGGVCAEWRRDVFDSFSLQDVTFYSGCLNSLINEWIFYIRKRCGEKDRAYLDLFINRKV